MGFGGRERKRMRNLDMEKKPGDMERKRNVKDGRAIMPHDSV